MSNIYYLFGSEAVAMLTMLENETRIAEEINAVELPYAVFKWTDETHPSELLEEYAGWNNWVAITETLYNLLKR